jgi:hypothetical protein
MSNPILIELTTHPLWNKLKSVIKLTYSKRERLDEQPHPKFDIPRAMVDDSLMSIKLHCPYCGNTIAPVRQRFTAKRDGVPYPTGAYVSLVCPLTVNPGCCRSNEGQHAVDALHHELLNRVAV